jgi:hypothetical protein
MVTTIALPHSWCNYGGVIEAFKAKYPNVQVNELNPDAGSADELEAIRANKDNAGPQAPDVIDVGFSFGPFYFAGALICGSVFLAFASATVKTGSTKWARMTFFASLIYLPVILLLMVVDRV